MQLAPGFHTRQEILSQPDVWETVLTTIRAKVDTIQELYRNGRYQTVVFTGCGSTYYLSLAAASLVQELTGKTARGLPASEIWLYPGSAYSSTRRTLLVAVSRSGATTETLRAIEVFSTHGNGEIVTLSCHPGNPMAGMGALNLIFPEAQEESVAQTRAFSALYLAVSAVAAIWSGNTRLLGELACLPEAGRRLLENGGLLAKELGSDPAYERFYFLGSGLRYGLACELSLKMKEMSLSHSEPFHFMEFRHGPMSMVSEQTLLVGLLSEANQAQEQAVLDQMQARGAHILSIGEKGARVNINSGITDATRGTLYLPFGQMLSFERALSRGLDPDRPHNLEAVVRLAA